MKDFDGGVFDNVLTTGCGGMLGGYVDFGIRTNHQTLDVTDLAMVRRVCHTHMPKVIIHLAAATDLAHCEKDPNFAYKVNAVGTYNVALVAREIGARMVYVSTSNVFDGTKKEPYVESDIPNPINVYGHSKYLGELAVQGIGPDHLIVRVTWVFGGGPERDKKFVGKILQQIDQKNINVVTGKCGSPTYGKDAVAGIKELILQGERGVVNLPNEGVATRVDIASEIVAITKSGSKIQEVTDESFNLGYAIGENDSMISRSFFMRPWRAALREYIEVEWDVNKK